MRCIAEVTGSESNDDWLRGNARWPAPLLGWRFQPTDAGPRAAWPEASAMTLSSRTGALALLAMLVAARVDAGEPLDFREAARRTLASHPDTARLAAEVEAATARAALASQKPPFDAGVELENFAGTGSTRAVDAAELTVTLGSVVERGNKRAACVAVAERSLGVWGGLQIVRHASDELRAQRGRPGTAGEPPTEGSVAT